MMQGHETIMQSNFHRVTSYNSRNFRPIKFYTGGFGGKKLSRYTAFHNIRCVHVVQYSDKLSDGGNFCYCSKFCTNCTVVLLSLDQVRYYISLQNFSCIYVDSADLSLMQTSKPSCDLREEIRQINVRFLPISIGFCRLL